LDTVAHFLCTGSIVERVESWFGPKVLKVPGAGKAPGRRGVLERVISRLFEEALKGSTLSIIRCPEMKAVKKKLLNPWCALFQLYALSQGF